MFVTDPKIVADICVNLLGAVGVLTVAVGLFFSNPQAPVVVRIRWALVLVAALFLFRSLAWGLGSSWLETLSALTAIATPLAALIVAEGLARRHAPLLVKSLISGASLLAMLLQIIPAVPTPVADVALLIAVGGGFALVGFVLAIRDTGSLSTAENSSVRRVMFAMCLLVPLIATDFRGLFPDMPLRFGALGSLIMLFLAFGPSGTAFRIWERSLALTLFAGIACIFALGYVSSTASYDSGQLIRTASVGIAGLIVAGLFFELLGTRAERRKSADPLLMATSTADLMDRLRDHDTISGAVRLGPTQLSHLRDPAFDRLLSAHRVLRLEDAPWGRSEIDPGTERTRSLLTTYEATHVLVLSQEPLDLVVFHIPPSATDVRLESELQAVQRIGQLLYERRQDAAA